MSVANGEWRLVYPGTDYVFGTPAHDVYHATAPDLGDSDIATEDASRPREDGVAFGQDYHGGRTITFDLGAWGETPAAASAALNTLAGVWRGDAVRNTAGAVAELQANIGGTLRSVFGRPRRFAPVIADIGSGIVSVTADFACADDLWYANVDSAELVPFVAGTQGGLSAPLSAPLTTTGSADRSHGITIGGSAPAWPVFTVTGPITTPVIDVVGLYRFTLQTTLASDAAVTIDTRPWARSVTLRGGGSLAGLLTRDSPRLSRASIPPGAYELALRGVSTTGTASLSVTWRDAYYHI